MRKVFALLLFSGLLCISFFSCQKGELLNSEADILEIILPDSLQVGEPIISNDEIQIPKIAIFASDIAKLKEQLSSLTPQFILTPGATISNRGVACDFNSPQTYTVTSEDGKWKKEYKIIFFDSKFNNNKLDFTYYDTILLTKSSYYKFYEINDSIGIKQNVWDSGNSGFSLTAPKGAEPKDYPTSATLNGKEGSGAMLTTCSTGQFGATVEMPIAAGNLFLGYFESRNAVSKPLEATLFGFPTTQPQPQELKLWCKYKAGPEYKDRFGNIQSIIDSPEIYSVLYEPELNEKGNPIRLNGTNVRTADNIVSIAVLSPEQVEQIRVSDIDNDEYIPITIPFTHLKSFDTKKQKEGAYYLTIVFSSSAKGNLFEGAVGSRLCVDKVEIIRPK